MALGEFLNKYFIENGYKFDKVIIETSPFVSCIMTASHLAKILGCGEVNINYRASKIIFTSWKGNPVKELKWTKGGFTFEGLLAQNPEFQNENYFSKGVQIKEPENADFKNDMGEIYPETYRHAHTRLTALLDIMNNRIKSESPNGEKQICHLIVTHAMQVDETSHVLEHIVNEFQCPWAYIPRNYFYSKTAA